MAQAATANPYAFLPPLASPTASPHSRTPVRGIRVGALEAPRSPKHDLSTALFRCQVSVEGTNVIRRVPVEHPDAIQNAWEEAVVFVAECRDLDEVPDEWWDLAPPPRQFRQYLLAQHRGGRIVSPRVRRAWGIEP